MKLISQISNAKDVVSKEYVEYLLQSRYVVVAELPNIEDAQLATIYLVKDDPADTDYLEYIVIEEGGTRRWELIGNTKIDLTDYLKKRDLMIEFNSQVGTTGVVKTDGTNVTASSLTLADFAALSPNSYLTTKGNGDIEASPLTLEKFINQSAQDENTQILTLDSISKKVKARNLKLSDFVGIGASSDEGKFLKIDNNGNVVFGDVTWEEYNNN